MVIIRHEEYMEKPVYDGLGESLTLKDNDINSRDIGVIMDLVTPPRSGRIQV